MQIKRLTDETELKNSVKVIRQSFATVARDFNLTRENASTNAAFIEFEDLLRMKQKDILMFGVYKDEIQVGFFTLEKPEQKLYYLNKLGVLPEYRHDGFGKGILDYVGGYVERNGGGRISIGIIDENTVLKNWYTGYGFVPVETRKYPHLPFTVCLMEKPIL